MSAILVDLGILTKGRVVVKNPSDFVGAALGRSEERRKGILATTAGKVLVVDEAFELEYSARNSLPGSPETGKTTTAKKTGKVFYNMGFLSKADIIKCYATDPVGQYAGQTGAKVLQLLNKALGRVLFIDEVYGLGEGHFAK
ncbi:hypothetical protein MCOR03_003236 [Pyricularia oryzae]|nr:hypothetical protein MCOR09_008013 [Pyricularia oryzae]KAI6562739.1 hypothetical protein MCOR03_003236 [Pyricularia oryzae]